MRFRFIGKDGSMGLKKGSIYKLTTMIIGGYIVVRWDKGKPCPYSSLEAFLLNWEVVR